MNKKNKKNIFIISLVLFLFLLTSCNQSGDFYDPYIGTEGLYLDFLRNAPPSKVYENEEIPIGIFIKNNGAYDINRGLISFSYSQDYLQKLYGDGQDILLMGRDHFNRNGEETNKMFYFKVGKLEELSQIHDTRITATACYEYNTRLNADVCIDTDPYNLNKGEKPCISRDLTFSGQGAPLAITKIKPSIKSDQDSRDQVIPTFEIEFKNLGNGKVLDFMTIDKYCSSQDFSNLDFNTVDINVKIGQNQLTCIPNPVKLNKEDIGKTICSLPLGINEYGPSYSSLMQIDLLYGYTFSRSHEFTIIKHLI